MWSMLTLLFMVIRSSVVSLALTLFNSRLDVGRLGQDLGADHRRDVVRELQMLVVLEQHEVVGRDVRVGREQLADVDLAGLDRGHGQRTTRVERLEVLEIDAVGLLQARDAERPVRTLGRAAEHQVAGRPAPGCDRVLRLYLSAVALVTTKPFVSTAGA